ncbi:M23 family metallopeptidase [Vibrio sp. RE86]|uniref:M23 family metallopeptidase n=1 Tax=Vibrio sp. RE86 TaxID=2607605 RepID=UPI00149392C8|nr:M23 family metallopeptidase [Vibrio sp. RE86]NOH79868.1 M23 family metallopeptidase [Vibrio sp. RE86]
MQAKGKVLGTVVIVVLTLAWAKWDAQRKSAQHQAENDRMEPEIAEVIAKTDEAYELPMKKSGLIQDYAEFGKVKRFANLYHTAADYYALPGDEVYAVADGTVYFSGHNDAYGGLVVVNHADHGIYSLYGHVSARRWLVERGVEVKKGELIGYIADTDEGYGIGAIPHLHFSMRLGNPEDYPRSGKGNWMTGYTPTHPAFNRFVDPNRFIARSKLHHK